MSDAEQARAPGVEFMPPTPRAGVESFLYWAGSKSTFVPLVMPCVHRRLLRTGGDYVDPFLGGGAFPLDLGIGTREAPRMWLGDVNAALIETYIAVRDRWDAVAAAVAELAEDTTEARYLQVRDEYNSLTREHRLALSSACAPSLLDAGAQVALVSRFLYLNALAHSGLYRVNKSGDFNTPYGHQFAVAAYKRMALAAALEAASRSLQGARLYCGDFQIPIDGADDGDVVVADPPYDGVAFTDYSTSEWTAAEQTRLAASLKAAHGRGAEIIGFNNDTPLVRELYQGWCHVLPTAESRLIKRPDGGPRLRAACVIVTTDLTLLGE